MGVSDRWVRKLLSSWFIAIRAILPVFICQRNFLLCPIRNFSLCRNDLQFADYRRFTADATITLETPSPLSEEKLKEGRPIG